LIIVVQNSLRAACENDRIARSLVDPIERDQRLRNITINALSKLALILEDSADYVRALSSEAVLHLASPDRLADLTIKAYDRNPKYLSRDNLGLFAWEDAVLREYLPAAPASILVAACGGGREMQALAQLGYKVSGFEPGAALVETARSIIPSQMLGQLRVLSFEAFIASRSPIFDCVDALILGWGSLSHVSVEATRIALLNEGRELCPTGPIILSWVKDGPTELELKVRERISGFGIKTRDVREGYSTHGGYTRSYSYDEVFTLAAETGQRVVRYDEGDYPHAVLLPRLSENHQG